MKYKAQHSHKNTIDAMMDVPFCCSSLALLPDTFVLISRMESRTKSNGLSMIDSRSTAVMECFDSADCHLQKVMRLKSLRWSPFWSLYDFR